MHSSSKLIGDLEVLKLDEDNEIICLITAEITYSSNRCRNGSLCTLCIKRAADYYCSQPPETISVFWLFRWAALLWSMVWTWCCSGEAICWSTVFGSHWWSSTIAPYGLSTGLRQKLTIVPFAPPRDILSATKLMDGCSRLQKGCAIRDCNKGVLWEG